MPERIAFPAPLAAASAASGSASVLVSGTIAYDDILTPSDSIKHALGGSGSYAALAASFFADTRLAGIVGSDFAVKDFERLKKRGIDTAGVNIVPAGETFFWRGKYHENYNSRDTLETRLGVNAHDRSPLPDAWRDSPFILLANDEPRLQHAVIAQLRAPRFILVDTMNLWIDTAQAELLRVTARADLFVVNDSEAQQLTGESNLIVAGRKMLKRTGARSVLVKKGEHGALLFHPEGMFAIPSYPVTALRDPTGAGDSFAGAFIGVLAALDRVDFAALRLAALYATAVASLTVESFSCDRLESAGIAEIEKRADEIRDMTRIPK